MQILMPYLDSKTLAFFNSVLAFYKPSGNLLLSRSIVGILRESIEKISHDICNYILCTWKFILYGVPIDDMLLTIQCIWIQLEVTSERNLEYRFVVKCKCCIGGKFLFCGRRTYRQLIESRSIEVITEV